MTDEGRTQLSGRGAARRVVAAFCLLAPVVALVWVPWYAGAQPMWAGVPFFYWYQLAWIPGCAVALSIAHLLTRGSRGSPGS
ncbi:DUF3311 domain-containing protein [Streptomyces sp. LE64]|uniref:DUF3311 domain-containing protein n=1 Tax=Streptomyces sp. LE64 TaxID=3448653 RepID=UPI0040430696